MLYLTQLSPILATEPTGNKPEQKNLITDHRSNLQLKASL